MSFDLFDIEAFSLATERTIKASTLAGELAMLGDAINQGVKISAFDVGAMIALLVTYCSERELDLVGALNDITDVFYSCFVDNEPDKISEKLSEAKKMLPGITPVFVGKVGNEKGYIACSETFEPIIDFNKMEELSEKYRVQ